GVRHRRVPDAQAEAATAQVGAHDVEAEEGKARVVIDAGDSGRRRAIELANQEALRIDRSEAGGVGEAGVPAFRRGPVGGERNLPGPHRPYLKIVRRWHHRSPSRRGIYDAHLHYHAELSRWVVGRAALRRERQKKAPPKRGQVQGRNPSIWVRAHCSDLPDSAISRNTQIQL